MEQPSQELLLRLVDDARAGLSQRGFHFLSRDEIDQLCANNPDPGLRLRQLKLFVRICGAQFETNRDVTAARLVNPLEQSLEDCGETFEDADVSRSRAAAG
ncbi:MAG TPA: hypothetical protein VF614_02930 [Chthoniobacteraceae bacterium]|jgi:hypothetical protein